MVIQEHGLTDVQDTQTIGVGDTILPILYLIRETVEESDLDPSFPFYCLVTAI